MKSKLGILLMAMGSMLMAAALGLFLYNRGEQHNAAESVEILMPQVVKAIQQRQETPTEPVFL